MASTPKTPAKPQAKIYHPPEAGQLPAESQPAPAEPAATIADEQRARSAEIAAMGVDKWKEAHDERTEEEKAPRQVAGVPPGNPEAKSWEGSTRTTQAARHAQNPAAPR